MAASASMSSEPIYSPMVVKEVTGAEGRGFAGGWLPLLLLLAIVICCLVAGAAAAWF